VRGQTRSIRLFSLEQYRSGKQYEKVE
jgi:hypothetical protein